MGIVVGHIVNPRKVSAGSWRLGAGSEKYSSSIKHKGYKELKETVQVLPKVAKVKEEFLHLPSYLGWVGWAGVVGLGHT